MRKFREIQPIIPVLVILDHVPCVCSADHGTFIALGRHGAVVCGHATDADRKGSAWVGGPSSSAVFLPRRDVIRFVP